MPSPRSAVTVPTVAVPTLVVTRAVRRPTFQRVWLSVLFRVVLAVWHGLAMKRGGEVGVGYLHRVASGRLGSLGTRSGRRLDSRSPGPRRYPDRTQFWPYGPTLPSSAHSMFLRDSHGPHHYHCCL